VTIADLGALYKENSLLSFLCSILLFSLTGLPPFAGFFLKVELLTNIMSSYFFSTIIILTVVGTFSAFYYIRIIKGLYYEKSTT
jgi:NADH-quinone oxidoreductase subunit N